MISKTVARLGARAFTLVGVALSLPACATMTRGTTQEFTVESTPPGAQATTSNGFECVSTPCTFRMSRKDAFNITVSKEGYVSQTHEITSSMSGAGGAALAGNVLVGGIIGGGRRRLFRRAERPEAQPADGGPAHPGGRSGGAGGGPGRSFNACGRRQMMRRLAATGLVAAVMGVAACATPSNPANMTLPATAGLTAARGDVGYRSVTSVAVSGGQGTNPLWTSQVSNADFKTALEASLTAAGYMGTEGQPMRVSASLIDLKQPLAGFDLTVTSRVRYTVTRDSQTVFDENGRGDRHGEHGTIVDGDRTAAYGQRGVHSRKHQGVPDAVPRPRALTRPDDAERRRPERSRRRFSFRLP